MLKSRSFHAVILMNKSFAVKIFELFVVRSWWVCLILLICYVGYNIGIKKRNNAIYDMKCKYENLLKEKQIVLNKKEDLLLKLQSQSDPDWIEMVLMKELGVVPENKIKVQIGRAS